MDDAIEVNSILSSSGSPWLPKSTSDLTGAAPLITLLALFLPLSLYYAYKLYQKMQDRNRKPFPFIALPRELRDMIYMHLLEDPAYPILAPRPKNSTSHWQLSGRWTSPIIRAPPRTSKKSNWIVLANKQLHEEFMDLVCKKRTLHLTVSPQNYQRPSSSSSDDRDNSEQKQIWTIAPSTLQHVRTCDLQLITTSSMLGVSDPRNMKSDDWALARQVRHELRTMSNVTHFTLDAKAIGDPLWNPLWIWYHASQSFKDMGTAHSPSQSLVEMGPKLAKITFSLDTWSPGENHLRRDEKGEWMWYCIDGHVIGPDGGSEVTVREFCARLYQECAVCRPEEEVEVD